LKEKNQPEKAEEVSALCDEMVKQLNSAPNMQQLDPKRMAQTDLDPLFAEMLSYKKRLVNVLRDLDVNTLNLLIISDHSGYFKDLHSLIFAYKLLDLAEAYRELFMQAQASLEENVEITQARQELEEARADLKEYKVRNLAMNATLRTADDILGALASVQNAFPALSSVRLHIADHLAKMGQPETALEIVENTNIVGQPNNYKLYRTVVGNVVRVFIKENNFDFAFDVIQYYHRDDGLLKQNSNVLVDRLMEINKMDVALELVVTSNLPNIRKNLYQAIIGWLTRKFRAEEAFKVLSNIPTIDLNIDFFYDIVKSYINQFEFLLKMVSPFSNTMQFMMQTVIVHSLIQESCFQQVIDLVPKLQFKDDIIVDLVPRIIYGNTITTAEALVDLLPNDHDRKKLLYNRLLEYYQAIDQPSTEKQAKIKNLLDKIAAFEG
jgi:hypothetical protein